MLVLLFSFFSYFFRFFLFSVFAFVHCSIRYMPVLGTLVPSATCPFWAPCLSRFLHRPQWASTTFVTFFFVVLCRFPGVAGPRAGFFNKPTPRSLTFLSFFFNFFSPVWAWPKPR